MSRIGNKAITIPAGVEVNIAAGNEVTVKGPKGTLTRQFNPELGIKIEENVLSVTRPNEQKHTKQLHGTTRACWLTWLKVLLTDIPKNWNWLVSVSVLP